MTTQNRTDCLLGRDQCAPTTLAQQIHCDARHSSLSSTEIVKSAGCDLHWFYKQTSDAGRAVAPAWLLLSIATITGRTGGIEWLAREAGLIAFRPMRLVAGASLGRTMSPLLRRFATWCETFEAAHEDGVYTPAEAEELTRQAHAFTADLYARVNAVRQGAGLPADVYDMAATDPHRDCLRVEVVR